jgi:tellurite resistance protein
MTDAEAVVRLPDTEPAQLAAAVESALNARGDLTQKLRVGAQESARDEPEDVVAARRFQTLLELGYLVASADGFADEESASLAGLLERVTSKAIDRAALELHFQDLDAAVDLLGRRQRLARSAADLEDEVSAEEAIGLVATIAMADGCLSAAEYAALVELGQHMKISAARTHALVEQAAAGVEEGLR